MRQTEFFIIWGHSLPFYQTKNPKNQNFEKYRKHRLEISSFYNCVPQIRIIGCMIPQIWNAADRFFLVWTNFCPFTPLTIQKIKILKKRKKLLEISSFYTIVQKIMIICYTYCSWDMAHDTCNCYFSFWAVFWPFYPFNSSKNKKF